VGVTQQKSGQRESQRKKRKLFSEMRAIVFGRSGAKTASVSILSATDSSTTRISGALHPMALV